MINFIIRLLIICIVYFFCFITLWVGSFKTIVMAFIPDCCCCSANYALDHRNSIIVSLVLSLMASSILTYFFNFKDKKIFILLYFISFLILCSANLYILKERLYF